MNLKRRTRFVRYLALPLVILLAATLGYFWRILFTADTWKPAGGGDLVSFLFPTYRYAAATLRAGQLPFTGAVFDAVGRGRERASLSASHTEHRADDGDLVGPGPVEQTEDVGAGLLALPAVATAVRIEEVLLCLYV